MTDSSLARTAVPPDSGPQAGDGAVAARVLLVDDSPANLLALSAVLEPLGVQLETAANGLEALRLLLHQDFAVVVLDVHMPGGVSGFEVARLLRERERTRHLPLIFVTGKELAPESVAQGYTHGAVDYLLKPVDPHALRSKVSVFVDLYRAREEVRRQAEVIQRQERALAEALKAELHQSEALFRSFFGGAGVPLVQAEPATGRMLAVNAAFCRALGYREEELVGRAIWELSPPEARAQDQQRFERLAREEIPAYSAEKRYLRKDGSAWWGEVTANLLRDPEGRVTRVAAVVQDLTERKAAEAAREEGERQLRLLTDALPVVVAFIDAEQRYRLANRTYEAWFGLDPASLIGRTMQEVLGDEVYLRVRHHIEAALRGEPQLYEQELPYRQGSRTVRAMYIPHRTPTGAVEGFFVLVTDISEQARHAKERTRLLEEAQAGVRLRDEFLSVASHELRTPVTSLQLQLQLLARALVAGSPEAERLGTAQRQVARLAALIGSLLDVSRIAGGRLELQRAPADLSALVREALERLAPVFAEAGCPVELQLPPGPVQGLWDVQRVDQVLVNLLSNAAKYGAGSPVQVRIDRVGECEAERVRVSVTDGGIGIAPEVLPRLFGRFERGVSDRNYGGLGLGLYISRQLAEAMGGSIAVQSEAGRGSTFTLELPLGLPPEVPERA
ncbi:MULTISPECIES: PAS domain S-box protein [Myxococcaceae]|uniref:hybrid sensor histidine kinase/response regulator n=1 Tax=Myxococcaceae TaxID=31 RepID=UPI00188F19C6|nr:PAS domain S-box protein [Simulacricoccus sp. 17bor-14]